MSMCFFLLLARGLLRPLFRWYIIHYLNCGYGKICIRGTRLLYKDHRPIYTRRSRIIDHFYRPSSGHSYRTSKNRVTHHVLAWGTKVQLYSCTAVLSGTAVFSTTVLILYCHLWLPLYKGFGAFEMNRLLDRMYKNPLSQNSEKYQKRDFSKTVYPRWNAGVKNDMMTIIIMTSWHNHDASWCEFQIM
jgi:hypothetical protein